MKRDWNLVRRVSTATSLALIVAFTTAGVSTNGSGPTLVAIILGLVPVVLFFGGTASPRGAFLLVMLAALTLYTASWIYGTLTYSKYMLGGLDFIVIPVSGILIMAPLAMVYWLIRMARDFWRSPSDPDSLTRGR